MSNKVQGLLVYIVVRLKGVEVLRDGVNFGVVKETHKAAYYPASYSSCRLWRTKVSLVACLNAGYTVALGDRL